MGRITNTGATPAKERRAHIRSCAEALRLLAERDLGGPRGFDAEAKDMTAFLVFHLRGIYATIDESAFAWDDRNYWKKAEALREKWRWSRKTARELEALVLAERWAEVPPVLIGLVPHFADVTINQLTRDADWWCGALRALKRQAAKRTAATP
jgi:hypothetical protein